MSKPLVLKVYPQLRKPIWGDEIMAYREQWKRERAVRKAKRLTGPELAAETWKAKERSARLRVYFPHASELWADRASTLERFAILPHHDEETER